MENAECRLREVWRMQRVFKGNGTKENISIIKVKTFGSLESHYLHINSGISVEDVISKELVFSYI